MNLKRLLTESNYLTLVANLWFTFAQYVIVCSALGLAAKLTASSGTVATYYFSIFILALWLLEKLGTPLATLVFSDFSRAKSKFAAYIGVLVIFIVGVFLVSKNVQELIEALLTSQLH